MKPIFTLLLLALTGFSLSAQTYTDTLGVMVYNVMKYGATGSCPNVQEKTQYIKTIIQHQQPDIFAINELEQDMVGSINQLADKMLNESLNSGGISYDRAEDSGIGPLVNMIYFNDEKFELVRQEIISKGLDGDFLIRDIDVYHFEYLPEQNISQTIELTCVVAHLKAGSAADDLTERFRQTEAIMNYLESNKISDNILVMGDFNLKSSVEDAYQYMLNYPDMSIRFEDPVNADGDWNDDVSFSNYHSQSTHLNAGNCFASGGLDDRFDFILATSSIMNRYFNIGYLADSYLTIGQSGNNFETGLDTTSSNTIAPQPVLSALWNNSDHLPIAISLEVIADIVGEDFPTNQKTNIEVTTQLSTIQLKCNSSEKINSRIILQNLQGRTVFQDNWQDSSTKNLHHDLPPGVYFIQMPNINFHKKLVIW